MSAQTEEARRIIKEGEGIIQGGENRKTPGDCDRLVDLPSPGKPSRAEEPREDRPAHERRWTGPRARSDMSSSRACLGLTSGPVNKLRTKWSRVVSEYQVLPWSDSSAALRTGSRIAAQENAEVYCLSHERVGGSGSRPRAARLRADVRDAVAPRRLASR